MSLAIAETSVDSSRCYRLAKEGCWIIAGQIASVIGSLFLVRVLTEHLDPAQYGQLALALTLGTLICQVAYTGAMPGIMRYYTVAAEKGDARRYFAASCWMMSLGTVAALGLSTLLMIGLVVAGHVAWLGLVAIAVVFSMLGSHNSTLSMIQNAARQRAVVAFHGGLDPWLRVLFVALLFAWLMPSAGLALMAYMLSLLLVLSSQAFFMRRLITGKSSEHGGDDNGWSRQIWQYSKPFVFFNMFTWLQASSDRWALAAFANTHEVGLYAVLMQLGYTPISMATGMIMALVSPILFQRAGDATDATRNASAGRLAWQLTLAALALTVLAFLLATFFHRWIFHLLVAQEYQFVSGLLPWMILAGGLFAASQVIATKLMSDLNTQALIAPKIITSVVGAMSTFGGAYLAGLRGVIVGLVSFSVLHLLWIGWLGSRKLNSPARVLAECPSNAV